MKHITQIMPDASEIINYDTIGIPLHIQKCFLSNYPKMHALCHWHEDIEIIHIWEGQMNYYVNGTKLLLNETDTLMINSKQMHYGYSHRNQNCTFICFLFHPNLFTQNTLLYQNYIHPVIQASSMDYLLFSRENPSYRTVCTLMTNILELKEEGHIGYELEVIGKIHQLWNIIFHYYKHNLPNNDFDLSPDLAAQKNMVSYICQHYQEKLSLSDIASAGNVCRSKCCMIFKRYLQQSPIEFLNYYRLEISLNLLKNTTENITNIALTCGFNHLSYYSKLFFRRYGCTPRNYRRQYSKNYKGRV